MGSSTKPPANQPATVRESVAASALPVRSKTSAPARKLPSPPRRPAGHGQGVGGRSVPSSRKQTSATAFSRRPILEALEPRLLLSADLNPLAHDALLATPTAGGAEFRALTDDGRSSAVTSAAVAPVRQTNEIVFVDPRVPDREQLLATVTGQVAEGRHFEIITLDPNRPGIAQVTDALAGKVQLGGTWLDAKALAANSEAVAKGGDSLKADADLLFYGCDLTQTARGRALVDWIAELTRADVAASNDVTGSATQGGDWDLEYRTGDVETPVVVSLPVQGEWDHLLAAITFTVTNTSDSGAGSLREAITSANATPGADTIVFNVAGTGVRTIALSSTLTITDDVTIDGWSEGVFQGTAGYNGPPLIEVTRGGGGNYDGLTLLSGNSTVRGLVIDGFQGNGSTGGSGIVVNAGATATIQGNYIGTNAAGTAAKANDAWGIWLKSGGNVVGGTTAAERNVISGNGVDGIRVDGANNIIQGNYIGTDKSGTSAIGNTQDGIWLTNASNNTIGGAVAGARNVISSNLWNGIEITGTGTGNVIQGNYVGTDATGTVALGNDSWGVRLASPSNLVGGTAPGAGNVISGNGVDGIYVDSVSGNIIQGNYIGTDRNGILARGNSEDGIWLNDASNTTIGGIVPEARNVISANGWIGIEITGSGTGNVIQGNYIGTDKTGAAPLGNVARGVRIAGSTGTAVGGTAGGSGNLIAYNTMDGVTITA